VLRIIQQALANVRQHAEAGQVVVTVRMADDHLTASVEDDGMGFDAEAVLAAGPDADGQHQGLVGMRERARLLRRHQPARRADDDHAAPAGCAGPHALIS